MKDKFSHLDSKERQMDKARNSHEWCDDLESEFSPDNEREEQLVKSDVPISEIERLREIRRS